MSWRTCRLGDVLTLKRGHDLPEDSRLDGDIPVVSSSGITGRHKVAKATAPGVVTGRYGTIGEVFYLEEDYWPLNTALYVIDFKGNNPRFLAYFLRNILKGYKSEKAAVPGVDRNVIHELRVRVPSHSLQLCIADILSTYDNLIENNRRRMALLQESARLLYREWFIRLRFPGYEHTPIVDGVPQGWEYKTLESVCLAGNGIQTGPFGSQLHQADYSEDGVPVVMPKDLVDFRVSTASIAKIPEGLADSLGKHRMIPGDTVYGRRGDIGRRAFIGQRQQGWFCGTGSLRIRPNPKAVNPLYLFDHLGTPAVVGDITNRAKGSTMLNLSAAALKPVPVLVPSRALQKMYAEQIEQVREMVEVLDEQNQKLRAARDLLLPRLMRGELVI